MSLRRAARTILLLLALIVVVAAILGIGYEAYIEISAGQKSRALNAIERRLEELGREIDDIKMKQHEDSIDRKYKEPKR